MYNSTYVPVYTPCRQEYREGDFVEGGAYVFILKGVKTICRVYAEGQAKNLATGRAVDVTGRKAVFRVA